MARSWGKFKFIFFAWFFLTIVTAHGASQSHEEGHNSVRGGGKKKAKCKLKIVTYSFLC